MFHRWMLLLLGTLIFSSPVLAQGLRQQKTLLGAWLQAPESRDPSDSPDPIATDRPDFTESSTNVGKGRVQLEMGYTYFRDGVGGSTQHDQTYPELLLRVGIFADWLELRVGHTFGQTQLNSLLQESFNVGGPQDLYLGLGIALCEQRGILPELKITLQGFVPIGHEAITANEFLPGFNLLYGWDIIKDKITMGASTQMNRRAGEAGFYWETAQSITTGFSLTEKLGMFAETFALFPDGSSSADPSIGPEYYVDGGFTYQITPNFQLDIRAGLGLNRHATDFFTGTGLAVRY